MAADPLVAEMLKTIDGDRGEIADLCVALGNLRDYPVRSVRSAKRSWHGWTRPTSKPDCNIFQRTASMPSASCAALKIARRAGIH